MVYNTSFGQFDCTYETLLFDGYEISSCYGLKSVLMDFFHYSSCSLVGLSYSDLYNKIDDELFKYVEDLNNV